MASESLFARIASFGSIHDTVTGAKQVAAGAETKKARGKPRGSHQRIRQHGTAHRTATFMNAVLRDYRSGIVEDCRHDPPDENKVGFPNVFVGVCAEEQVAASAGLNDLGKTRLVYW